MKASGIARPEDETVSALNEALDEKPEGQYIWRTVGDEKVRPEHAALADTVRSYGDSPDPADDYNCRCWAEDIGENPYPDAIEPVYPEALLLPALRTRSIVNLLEYAIPRVVRNFESSGIDMGDPSTWPKPPRFERYQEGAPSRVKPKSRGEKSLYDENGGEWRYAREDEYHHAHWDYKATPKSPWENIQIDGKPIMKLEK